MFGLTKTGFYVKFDNGYIVSVQFGPGNMCDNRHMSQKAFESSQSSTSPNAEIAIKHETQKGFFNMHGDLWNDVFSNCSPEHMIDIMQKVARL